jgi:PAS domain S-box-containing protein
MAKTISVPAAVITRSVPSAIEIAVASASAGDPYYAGGRVVLGDAFRMYCQQVMERRSMLYVPDARRDENWVKWQKSPDVGLGMTCYMGFPLLWPDGEVFGTICVMDRQDNPEVPRYRDLVRQFARVVEDDLKLLVVMAEREEASRELEGANSELQAANAELEEAHVELEASHTELERRVQERTAELREALEVLHLAQHAASAGVWNYDICTERETWSKECYDVFGVDPGTPVTYTSWVDLTIPEDRGRVERAILENLEHHTDLRVDFRIDHPRRGRRWIQCVGRTFFDEGGKPVRRCGFKMDVTERKVAEEEVRRANAKVREVLESVTDAFSALDRGWRFTYVNEQVARNLGRTPEELIGRRIWDLFPEEVGGEGYEQANRAMVERVPVHYEYYIGQLGRWFDNHVYPTPEGVSIYSHDITDRKRVERELTEANAKVHEVLESITDVFAAVDREWRFTYANGRAMQYVGLPREKILGVTVWEMFPELRRGRAGKLQRKAMEERVPVQYERYVPGLRRWIEVHAYPTRDGLAYYVRDITDRKRAEHALKRAKRAAEGASRAKDQFIAMLSHELRTPLTPVLAELSAWERDEGMPAKVRKDVRVLRRNVELEARLIDDLLDSTRITRGKIRLQTEVTDVHDCIRRVLETCRGEAKAKGVALTANLAAREHWGDVDGGRIQQVLWNLLNNAIKFTPTGGKVRLATSDEEGQRMRIEVTDTGVGIDRAVLPRLFKPFEQGEQGKSRRFGGLGLGLMIAKNMVEMHGGRLTVSSEGRGKGSTFVVELPVTAERPKRERMVGAKEGEGKGERRRILLVEDDPDTLRILTRLLRGMGYVVSAANSVRAALDAAGREEFDLLISDLGLPDGSGLDVMREVKGKYGIEGIAVSGYGTDEDLRQSREAGFQRLITKPVTVGRLEEAVRQMGAGR